MKELILTLTADEPLVITSGSAESMAHECLGYIPGNMLLGALAAIWKRQNPDADPDDNAEFRRLFLNGDVFFGHALPLCEDLPSVPVPASYREIKNHGGLPPANRAFSPEDHAVFNLLALKDISCVNELWKKTHPENSDAPKIKRTPAGFMNPESLHRADERRVFNLHVALGDKRSSLQGQLFGYSALAAGTVLQSRLVCQTDESASALMSLLANTKALHVGHARSAGYGRVAIKCETREIAGGKTPAKTEFNLFLLSQYLPSPSWADALDNFCAELARIAGQKPEIVKSFTGFCEIQGFNGLWKRPRDTRIGLNMGGALSVRFANAVSLPENFVIGADCAEGYGRVLCDPPFLALAQPEMGPAKATKTIPLAAPKPDAGSARLWDILRKLAAKRRVSEIVVDWLNDERWKKFLWDVSRQPRPSASQRDNLRDMNAAVFKEMLKKTPGAQWRQAVAFCPFTGRDDHLSEIMPQLLDAEKFLASWPFSCPNLPGGPLPAKEGAEYGRKAHKLFIRELISIWGKMSNLHEEKE